MFLPPLLYIFIAPLEVSRVSLQPSLLRILLTLCLTGLVLAALLPFPHPIIRPEIPTTVKTPFLSIAFFFHEVILRQERRSDTVCAENQIRKLNALKICLGIK